MIVKAISVPVVAAGKVVRAIGAKRVGLLGVGAIAGALVTPVAGPRLRERLAEEIAKRRSGTQSGIEDRVRDRLANAPRTWHLTQPEVVAVEGASETGWTIILAGTAPDQAARVDLAETALAVTGVTAVDNRIRVTDVGEAS